MKRFKMWLALCTVLAAAPGTSLSAAAVKSINALSQTLPIEVLGAEGTLVSVTLTLTGAQAMAAQRLWLQTHNVRYPEKASVRINSGAWLALNNSTVQMTGTNLVYGGIGGAIATLKMSLPVASGLLQPGANTIAFRFNVSNGLSMGYRVIGMNVLDAAGGALLPAASFTEADPAQFVAPSTLPSEIAAGKQLWQNASLVTSFPPANTMLARCADCHTVSGADLKYFGYSNKSIVERAKFHGLSEAQGLQITSYIRSLPVKAIGRPWNPPYQPGPGVSAKPIDEWAAGAGIQNVLDDDRATLNALFPNGVKREELMLGDSNKFKRFSSHDTALAFQLPDWNHWLPEVHPKDAVGPWFAASRSLAHYNKVRTQLSGKTPEQIRLWVRNSNNGEGGGPMASTGYFAMVNLYGNSAGEIAEDVFPGSLNQNNRITDPYIARKLYSFVLWKMVKHFEIHEEFQLTGLGREPQNIAWAGYDGKEALPRMWLGSNRTVFDISPFLSSLEYGVTGSASGNNGFNYDYLSNAWYQLQLMLNAGQRTGFNHQVVDFGYAYGFLSGMNRLTGYTQVGRNFIWSLKGMDEGDNGREPNVSDGWSFNRASLRPIEVHLDDAAVVPPATPFVQQAMALLTQVWLEKNASWLPRQIFYYPDGSPKSGNEDGVQFDLPNYVLGTGNGEYQERGHADNLFALMPALRRSNRFPAALHNGYINWAQAMWPGNGTVQNNWQQFSYARVGAAPPAPLVNTVGNSTLVRWAPTAGASSYNVKRSDSASGPFLTVAYLRSGASYTDKVPLAGRTYYYRISSNNAQGESPDSIDASLDAALFADGLEDF